MNATKTERPKFQTYPDAFSYVREVGHPVVVDMYERGLWKLFPSGRAEPYDERAKLCADRN